MRGYRIVYLEKEKIVIKNGLKVDEAKSKKDRADLERYKSVYNIAKKIVICAGFVIGIVTTICSFIIEGKFCFEVIFSFIISTVAGFIIGEVIGAAFCHFKTKDIEDEYTLKGRLEEYDLLKQEINDIVALKKILLNKDTTVSLSNDCKIIEISGLDENGLERKFTININNVYYKDTDSFTIIYKMEDDNSIYRDIRCFYVDLELPRECYSTNLISDN